MADPCPVCQRPRLESDRTAFSPVVHCPRVDTSILGSVGQLAADNACLCLGLEARDRQIVADALALQKVDGLLARAREVLVDTEAKVTAALEQLGQEDQL